MAKTITPAIENVAQAKLLHAKRLYDGGAPITEMCDLLEMNKEQFRAFRDANGWPLRAPVATRKGRRPAEDSAAPPPSPKPKPETFIARLEDAVNREFARAEKALDGNSPKSIEAGARTLASLVKTLGELKRMRREQGAKDENDGADASEEPPRELAELRAELARRLDRMEREEQAE